MNDKNVVAVFSGTSTALVNYFKEPRESSTSRDAGTKKYYEEGKLLYPAFIHFSTGGLFRPETAPTVPNGNTDYFNAIPYGRPLFPALNGKTGPSAANEEKILERMLLGFDHDEWKSDDGSWLSLVGTRFQLGSVPLGFVSRMVSRGYANLSQFGFYDDTSPLVSHNFIVDPVCARLAMCMMDEDWKCNKLQGCSPKDWSKKMTDRKSVV